MRGPHNFWRLIRTGATFERAGAMRVALEAADAPRSIRIAARIIGWPVQWFGLRGDSNQPPILRALTALGPAYIKFGQLMSTRPDIVGVDLARELRVLQDALPAFETDVAKAEVESELGISIDDAFESFSEPVAAASLAQVHKAVVRETGQVVAVKVLRPGIERAFLKDVDAFYLAAWLIEFISPASRRLRPRAVIEHFAGVVDGELDLRMEPRPQTNSQRIPQMTKVFMFQRWFGISLHAACLRPNGSKVSRSAMLMRFWRPAKTQQNSRPEFYKRSFATHCATVISTQICTKVT